ncbi:magnesium-dependent phosphatase-1 [Mycena albidolilacea]|uniref:Magnesium-dependent phosphatase-1 n=1 Tax=Mycena albidolilacea TaxID=1033008 RepID=A0AAD7EKD2_9AGAR|nr:magnesium-dependent phosphatase-1 [Mycena albidolilacea]
MFPKLVAFDLDYTLWNLWIDTHVTGPLRKSGDAVVDAHGVPVEFYSDVPDILRRLRGQGVLIAACSRTHAPPMARQALQLLRVPGNDDEAEKPAIELFDDLQIYPGSKLTHFRALHAKTGIPYKQMLFFDDEPRNREVEKLGVVFHLTPTGVDNATFDAGVEAWKKRISKSAA